MPDYKPDAWNKPGVKEKNNCYSYACDDQHKGSDTAGANPGGTKHVVGGKVQTGAVLVDTPAGQIAVEMPVVIPDCDGMKNAAIADGLNDKNPCDKDCWRVAYFVRGLEALQLTPRRPPGYHWAREDSSGKWSHKPGLAGDATDKQYDPAKNDYTGKPITDPSKDNLGPGYTFCGYLCCCPNTKVVAMAPKRNDTLVGDGVCSIIGGPALAEALLCVKRAEAGPWSPIAEAAIADVSFGVSYRLPKGRRAELLVAPTALYRSTPETAVMRDDGQSLRQVESMLGTLRIPRRARGKQA